MTYEKKLREVSFFSMKRRWIKRDTYSVFISVMGKTKPDSCVGAQQNKRQWTQVEKREIPVKNRHSS